LIRKGFCGVAIVKNAHFRGDRLATQSGCNRRRLKPIPLVITHTQPFGRRLAFCSMSKDEGRAITLDAARDENHRGDGSSLRRRFQEAFVQSRGKRISIGQERVDQLAIILRQLRSPTCQLTKGPAGAL
jgi:hypothetical protein